MKIGNQYLVNTSYKSRLPSQPSPHLRANLKRQKCPNKNSYINPNIEVPSTDLQCPHSCTIVHFLYPSKAILEPDKPASHLLTETKQVNQHKRINTTKSTDQSQQTKQPLQRKNQSLHQPNSPKQTSIQVIPKNQQQRNNPSEGKTKAYINQTHTH